MNAASNTNVNQTEHELIFALDNSTHQVMEEPWYQNNDLVFPLLLIGIGLFQFVLRKWIAPVSEDITSRLEKQLPTQGLIYMPELGAIIALLGVILLVVLNILLPLAGYDPL